MSIVLMICKATSLWMIILVSTTYCNDHDWGDKVSYDLENLFKPHDEFYIDNNVCNDIESGFGRVSTLGNSDPLRWRMINLMKFLIKEGLERS